MRLLRIACGLSLACASVAAFGCEQPTVPTIPTKHELSNRQRRQALADTRTYTKGMADYVACIKSALQDAGKQAPPLSRTLLKKRYDGAIREFGVVTTLFVKYVGAIDSLKIGRVVANSPRNCISLASTRKQVAVDDYRILFYQRTGRIYVDALPRKCPGLRSTGGAFGLRTGRSSPHIEELCSRDSITLINGSHPGYTCRLGPFYELTKEQAATLLDGGVRLNDGTVTVKPVQLPPDGNETPKQSETR